MSHSRCLLPFALLTALVAAIPASHTHAQSAAAAVRAPAAHVVLPWARPTVMAASPGTVQVAGVEVAVDILEQVATTTVDLQITNAGPARAEAEILLPVPDSAVLRGFAFLGPASEPRAELLARDEARSVYDAIVARTRDPALLEFLGCQLLRSSVFPVEARGIQKVRVTYEQVLPADGDRVDYVLPRTESVDYRIPCRIAVKIASKAALGAVYSPTHALTVVRREPHLATVRLAPEAETVPGPFRLSYLRPREGFAASLLAYPDPGGNGGTFLLLASPPAESGRPGGDDADARPQPREVILVLDRSGSMAGAKLDQARAAALQVLEGLRDGEAFNLVVYSDQVETFSPHPVVKTAATLAQARAYLRQVTHRGGTNLHDALAEALRQPLTPGFLPLVLFLTDGLPTAGPTSERAIRDLARQHNPRERRVFTFGVGADVNTPLLDRLALDTRAVATYVLPGENVESRVGQVFQRLAGPVLAHPRLQACDAHGTPAPARIRDLLPARLPDLFEGDQWVLLGRYSGTEPLHLELSGNHLGRERTFRLRFSLDRASTANAFVPRLWASRRIAALTDAIRDLGVDSPPVGTANAFSSFRPVHGVPPAEPVDPRARELVDEVVRLSREFGILTEYTAFLAREGTDLTQSAEVLGEAYRNFSERAMQTRSGTASLNQSLNNGSQRDQAFLNARNTFLDARLNRVQIATVQQVNDRAFYRRGDRWIDSTLVEQPAGAPARVVEIGSEEFRRLATRLALQNRQGTLALGGEILLRIDGETVLVK